MSLAQPITYPFFSGSSVSSDVPGKFPVALAGRGFLLDLESGVFEHQTVPAIRQQQDSSDEPGGQSVNPQGLWRRTQDDWSHGAGQTFYDRPSSDRARFRSSKGVDVWTPHEVSLLAGTSSVRSSANTNLQLLVVGAYLYLVDGNQVYWTTDLSSWTSAVIHVAESAVAVKGIASDGYNVYAALGANGIHTTTKGATSSTHYNALTATMVGFAKGRLMAAQSKDLFNVTASGAAPTALLPLPNTDFTWVGVADGPGGVYAAGYSGDKSLIYRTTVKADGTALDVPVVAGSLLDGEIIRCIQGWQGKFLLAGTDKGWRLLEVNDNGDVVDMSDVIPTTSAVRCFEPQDHFIWYGLSNYDSTSTGLGRSDPGVFTKGLNPAFASDLMATTQGAVLSCVTFLNKRVFAVSGVGVFAETAAKVAQGTLDSGLVSFGIPEPKVAMFLDVRHEELAGTHAAYLAGDGGAWDRVGLHTTAGATSEGAFPAGQARADSFETRMELNRSTTDTATGPVITQTALLANPVIDSGEFIVAPLTITSTYDLGEGVELETRDVGDDFAFIVGLRSDRNVVTWQEGSRTYSVTVEDYSFKGYRMMTVGDEKYFGGTCVVKMKTIPEAG